jgi:hypothetical protein
MVIEEGEQGCRGNKESEVEAGEQEKCGKECKPKGSFGDGGSQENDDEKDEEKMAEWVFQA